MLAEIGPESALQYGALGVLTIALVFFGRFIWRRLEKLEDSIDAKDRQLMESNARYASSLNDVHADFASALHDVAGAIREQTRTLKNRPCLKDSTLDEDAPPVRHP
jgi:hypothetical protein